MTSIKFSNIAFCVDQINITSPLDVIVDISYHCQWCWHIGVHESSLFRKLFSQNQRQIGLFLPFFFQNQLFYIETET